MDIYPMFDLVSSRPISFIPPVSNNVYVIICYDRYTMLVRIPFKENLGSAKYMYSVASINVYVGEQLGHIWSSFKISCYIRSLISVFTVRSNRSLESKLPSCEQPRLIRLGRCFCWFCHVVPGFLGTPAGIRTTLAPFRASCSCSGPKYPVVFAFVEMWLQSAATPGVCAMSYNVSLLMKGDFFSSRDRGCPMPPAAPNTATWAPLCNITIMIFKAIHKKKKNCLLYPTYSL